LAAGALPTINDQVRTAVAGHKRVLADDRSKVIQMVMLARLLKRVFDIDMEHCPNCGGGELKIIAAILERPVIARILTHLGLDPQPLPRGRAREAGQGFAA
jgi:hypothetical protein